jgi:SagB-type dehydrogenase family enzyme
MTRFCFLITFLIMGLFSNKSFSNSGEVNLPAPNIDGNVAVEKVLNERQSVRQYNKEPLNLEEVSQVLWAAYGKNKWAKLTSPSAGALYPLTIYLAAGEVGNLEPGLYKYNNRKNTLTQVFAEDKRASLSRAALGQSWVKQAPAVIIICADYDITASRYGGRAQRYVDIEVGHVGQNIYLQATALNLGTVAVGAFSDDEVKDVLGVEEDPLYIMPLGRVK